MAVCSAFGVTVIQHAHDVLQLRATIGPVHDLSPFGPVPQNAGQFVFQMFLPQLHCVRTRATTRHSCVGKSQHTHYKSPSTSPPDVTTHHQMDVARLVPSRVAAVAQAIAVAAVVFSTTAYCTCGAVVPLKFSDWSRSWLWAVRGSSEDLRVRPTCCLALQLLQESCPPRPQTGTLTQLASDTARPTAQVPRPNIPTTSPHPNHHQM